MDLSKKYMQQINTYGNLENKFSPLFDAALYFYSQKYIYIAMSNIYPYRELHNIDI